MKAFALLEVLQPARLELEHAVQFNLGSLTVEENFASADNKAKRKNGGAASRLARVTVYWPEEGDFYTRNRKSSTGVRLRDGHCAVDPKVIPYGSVVNVPGIGRLIAVDTGGAGSFEAFGPTRGSHARAAKCYCDRRILLYASKGTSFDPARQALRGRDVARTGPSSGAVVLQRR